jgi:hypothetical protein
MKTNRTFDAYNRIGTAYVLLHSGYALADEPTRRDLVLAMDNVAASVGCRYVVRDEINLPAEALKQEFYRVVETIADVHESMHPLVQDDFEESLAIYLPVECLEHMLAHRLWETDTKNWARLIGLIITHLTENEPTCRRITEVIREYVAAA